VNDLFILLGISSWKPVLTALLLPPVPLLLMVLVGTRLVLPRRGLGWLIVLSAVVLLWLSACTGSARLLSQLLLPPTPALTPERIAELKTRVQGKQSVAIVVLGGGMRPIAPEYGVSNLNETSLERLRYGLWLGRETGAPVAFSGGVGWGQKEGSGASEAQIAARIAANEFNRPLKWQEDRSRDTRENAAYTVALLKPQGVQHLVIVTHHSHSARALRAFEAAAQGGLTMESAPVDMLNAMPSDVLSWLPSRRGYVTVSSVLHEAVGRLFGA
jgi:uncharacterized SAM-binding protein YcdF (DUF218 family)